MRKLICFLLLSLLALSLLSTPTKLLAQENIFTEDFSQSLSNWKPLRDDGRYWAIKNGKLEATIPFGSTVTELIPRTDAFEALESYVFELDFTPLSGADRNISFGVIDKNNWYELHFTPESTHLVKVVSGQVIWAKTHPYILQNRATYHLAIIFIKGHITLLINGSQVIDETDPTYQGTSGTIAVKGTTGGIYPTQVLFDNILVRKIETDPQIEGTSLGVSLLKQDDPEWASTAYDSAGVWASALGAGSTIKDWGCNLVSLVMVLRYHHITSLPDGSALSPNSLNQWLLENHGFYGDPPTGNIDRKSISLLTEKISSTFHTPKLEFRYIGDNLIETAITEIEKGNPVILELDGHFVVADGFTADKSDLYIQDPAYSIHKLSEHPLPLRSVRLFTPSQTDLSYISIISVLNIPIDISQATHYMERTRLFSTSSTPVHTAPTYITDVAKPSSDSYIISANNPLTESQKITVQTYTAKGESQSFELNVAPGVQTFELKYKKDGLSNISQKQSPSFTYKDFRLTVKQLAESNQIKNTYFKKILLEIIKPAETLTARNQQKLLQVVKIIIQFAPKSQLTKSAQLLLLDQVKLLVSKLKQ